MILRAAFAFSLVLLVGQRQPDVGFGRPSASIPFAEASDASRCNHNDSWLCVELQQVGIWRDCFLAGADRVRDDLNSRRR
ncbi:MAG TPA: hypothetical protein VII56_11650 [Rhizomicrobium sp.]